MTTEITTTESATERARRLWDGDANSTARALLKELFTDPAQDQAIGILLPWIAERVQNAIRTTVRQAEASAFTSPGGRSERVAQEIRTQTGRLPALDNLAIRTTVRQAEASAFTSPGGRSERVAQEIRTQTGRLPALDNLDLLLTLPVLVPCPGSPNQTITWGKMTMADHQARIGSLRTKQNALGVTIQRHEWAVGELRKYGARCLDDIDMAILKADMQP